MTASFSIPVYQNRLGSTIELTTLGLGPSTQRASAQGLTRAEELLRNALHSAVGTSRPGMLRRFELKRGTRLERVRLEIALHDKGKRRVSGLCPLIVEPRPMGKLRTMEICYHPAYQSLWFPITSRESIEAAATAYFAEAWKDLADHELVRVWSNTKDSLRMLAFSAQEKTLLGELHNRKKDIWADLEVDPHKPKSERHELKVLPRLGTDLTPTAASTDRAKLGQPRSPYREQLEVLLGGKRKSSVILVGAPGCGKSTIIRQLVSDLLLLEDYATHQNLDKVTHVWRILGKQLIAGMSMVGQWEQRCVELLDDLRGRAIVLTVPDLHLFGRIGRARDSERSIADFFRGPISRGQMVVLGECTPEQLQRLEEDDPAFAAAFTKIHVAPAARSETFRMMLAAARELELDGAGLIDPLVFEPILDFGEGLFPQHALPGKAVDLLNRVVTNRSGQATGPQDIVAHLSSTTGLPENLLSPKAPLAHADIVKKLGERVVGQPEALREAADLVCRIRAGLVDAKRPWGVYLFTGPTGTGKTELAKALSEYLYGNEGARLVRIDMSELSGPDGVSRLIGDPWHPEGILTSAVFAQPFCVVLLDEIEKAHPAVLNLLLQLFDDGRLTDAGGNTASFTQAVVIMTSNLGARQRPPVGFDEAAAGMMQDVARAVREFFPPELFNRIDAVVPFKPLTPDVAVGVTKKELGKLFARPGLVDRNAFVDVDDAAVVRIADTALRAEDGARSLKRFIEDKVTTLLGERIAAQPNAKMQILRIANDYEGLIVHTEPLIEAKPAAGRYELESLWNKPTTELRGHLAATLAQLEEYERSDRLAELADVLRTQLSEHNRGALANGELLYNIDWMRLSIEKLRDRIESLVVASQDLAHHRLEEAIMAREVWEPARNAWEPQPHPLPGRMRFDFGRAGTWWELFQVLAEAHILGRALKKVDEPGQHAVFVEVRPFGRGRYLRDQMIDAYRTSRGTDDGHAVFGDGSAYMLRVVGLCIRDFLELETGTHIWMPTVHEPELLQVRVTPAEPGVTAQDFARKASATAEILPIVRQIHFDAPTSGLAPLEMEDYVVGIPYSARVARIGEAFQRLWLLRQSRTESES